MNMRHHISTPPSHELLHMFMMAAPGLGPAPEVSFPHVPKSRWISPLPLVFLSAHFFIICFTLLAQAVSGVITRQKRKYYRIQKELMEHFRYITSFKKMCVWIMCLFVYHVTLVYTRSSYPFQEVSSQKSKEFRILKKKT